MRSLAKYSGEYVKLKDKVNREKQKFKFEEPEI